MTQPNELTQADYQAVLEKFSTEYFCFDGYGVSYDIPDDDLEIIKSALTRCAAQPTIPDGMMLVPSSIMEDINTLNENGDWWSKGIAEDILKKIGSLPAGSPQPPETGWQPMEIKKEMVERAAIAMSETKGNKWSVFTEIGQNQFRVMARAALEAALTTPNPANV